MSFLTNRHTVIAMLVAPVLAIGAYYAIDILYGERPQSAVPGQDYPLAEKPGCRYAGGECALKNADFEVQISFRPGTDGRAALWLESAHPLDGVVAALVTPEAGEVEPQALRRAAPDGRSWIIETPQPRADLDRVRIVASAAGARYFGEVGTTFTAPEPTND
jgi:hypothetical protein